MSIAGAAKVILFRGLQQALLQSIMSSAEPETLVSDPVPPAVAKTAIRNGNSQIVDKLRNLADAMQKEIDSKYNSGVSKQRYTARRASIAAGMAADGARLERIQAALRWLADQWELGITPRCLLTVRSKKAVEQVLTGYYSDNGKASHGITNAGDFESAKQHLQLGASGSTAKRVDPDREIRGLENELRGRKIDGFFPTPKSAWEWMKTEVGGPVRELFRWINKHGDQSLKIIDPSAGIGSLLDYLHNEFRNAAAQYNWEFYACEINHDCRKVLSAKGYLPVHDEINDCTDLDFEDGPFDVVLMNPPFENRADAKHVMHAYNHLLKPGGFMVAITSRGPWFASDSVSTQFRDWFSSLDSTSMCVLPDGAFNGSDSFRPTGVNCNVITIHKPA